MAKINTKLSNLVTDKNLGTKTNKKKQSRSKINGEKSENKQCKTNLKRGKLPSNWNSYVEIHNSAGTSKKVAQKFPKNLTRATNSANNAKAVGAMTRMGNPKSSITGKYIGIDCEMVGINDSGKDNMLARVSLVDETCSVIYDTFVKPTQRVVDYRTAVSGVRPEDIQNGQDFEIVQSEVHKILQDKVLVGHAIRNDLKVLYLYHNKKYIRDTSKFKKFREAVNGVTPSLKFLSAHFLGLEIQTGEHNSIEDARASMKLYLKFRDSWEAELRTKKR